MATRTTDLTASAKPIADEMAIRCGTLKVALSAGIIALSKLSAEQREQAIAEANGRRPGLADDAAEVEAVKSPQQKLTIVRQIVDSMGTSHVQILGQKDAARVAKLKKALGPADEAAEDENAAAADSEAKKRSHHRRNAPKAG